ncbi:MAG: AMP-binding protein [Persicimonas sp.]
MSRHQTQSIMRSEEMRRGWTSLGETLRGSAEHCSGAGIYVIDERGSQEFRTYAQLLEHSLRVGAALRLKGIDAHDRILLVQSTGFDFLSTFFGAIAIGATPVPFPPPTRQRSSSAAQPHARIEEAARRLVARAIVADSDLDATALPAVVPGASFGFVGDVGMLLEGMPVGAVVEPQTSAPEVAYVQLTSGATGPMRGVELTHANILSNIRAIGRALEIDSHDVGISWIPPYNSMGLAGLICVALYWGIDLVLLHPERFLKRPEDWLAAISRHRGTLTAAPNFAYHYAVRRCQRSNLEGLDLSSWRVAMSGAEPVRAQHIDAFMRRFNTYGLRQNIFMPVYGLAEATVGVTFGDLDAPVVLDGINRRVLEREGRARPLPVEGAKTPAERLHLVSVGRPLEGIEVAIVDDERNCLDERECGEVAVRGPCVMRGYTEDEPSQRGGGACDTDLDGEWLYTGDLGYLAEGRLYVIGRRCDAIQTARGRQIFPEEVELFVNSVDGIRSGSAVAFSIPCVDGDEHSAPSLLVIAFELQAGNEIDEIEPAVRALLSKHLSIDPHKLVALSPGSVPKTHSGKVRRFLARKLYLGERLERRNRNGELDGVWRVVARVQSELTRLGQQLYDRLEKLLSR